MDDCSSKGQGLFSSPPHSNWPCGLSNPSSKEHGSLSQWIKQPEQEEDNSPQLASWFRLSQATSSPLTQCAHGTVLKNVGNFPNLLCADIV